MAQEIQEPTQAQILEALRIVRNLAKADVEAIMSAKEITRRMMYALDDAEATNSWCGKEIERREAADGESN